MTARVMKGMHRRGALWRVFAAYVAFILALAVAGPGMTVLAAEGEGVRQPLTGQVPEVPAYGSPEAPADEPLELGTEPPAEQPEPVEDPASVAEPEGGIVELQASVEAPVATVAALVAPAKADKDEDDNSWICAGGVKLDGSPRTGTYTWDTSGTEETRTTPLDYEIRISTETTDDGMVMSFTSNYPVTKVRVKGGDDYTDYNYSPGVLSESGLHAPVNASGKYADISHIVFCFDPSGTHDSHIIVMKFRDDVVTNGEHDGGEGWLEGFAFDLYEGESETGPWTKKTPRPPLVPTARPDFGMWPTGWYKIVEVLSSAQIAAGETPTSGDPLGEMVFYHTGQVNSEKRFGNVVEEEPPAEEGDLLVYKFHDLDEDGEHDDGEPMLADWEFTLYEPSDLVPSMALAQLPPLSEVDDGLTDEDGELTFAGLEPGEYYVTETLQSGWVNTTDLTQSATVVDGETAVLWFGNVEEFLPFTELDLAITKLADRDSAVPGALVTYTLTYWNNGELAAENYMIVDDFDERYVTVVDANGGVVSGGKITWTMAGPLALEDGEQTLTYTVRINRDMPDGRTDVDNIVVIDHPQDADPTNNSDDERVVVRVDEPFLPFTGTEAWLLLAAALAAGTTGLALRLAPRKTS